MPATTPFGYPYPLPTEPVAEGAQRIRELAEKITAPFLVSSLPASPVDKQEVFLLVDATLGVIWHLRYRAGSSSSYKWEMVGGAPLVARVDTDQTFGASAAWSYTSPPGPEIVIPRSGEYEYHAHANLYHNTAAAALQFGVVNASVGAIPAISNIAGPHSMGVGVAYGAQLGGTITIDAGQTLRQAFSANGGGNANVRGRVLMLRPIRVS